MPTHQLIASLEGPWSPTTLALGLPASTSGLVLAVVLALCAPLVLAVARRRVVAQPLAFHLDEERRVLRAVLADPGAYVYIHQLESRHFVDERLGEIWERIAAHNSGVAIPEVPRDENAAYRILGETAERIPGDLVSHLTVCTTDGRLSPGAAGELTALAAESEALDREELVAQASRVYNAGTDRHEYAGSARIERTQDPLRPLRRVASAVSPLRVGVTVLLLALGGYVAGAAADAVATAATPRGATAAIAAALVVLTIGSVIWTLVDLETMYIDLPSFHLLAGISWFFALLGAWLDGSLFSALTGLVAVVAVVGFIELVNQVYKRVRGRHGMGMGDYLLIVATIGVPVAVTGSPMLGQVILIVSLLAGIVGWIASRITRPGFTRETPYAFGPYLASGWILGLLLWGVV